MRAWRWFVGQVVRLRRSIADLVAPDAEQLGRADEHIASADEPAAGPPAHWVERVRQGAPGLLEPSLRRRGEPARPTEAERAVPLETEPEPRPGSLEEPDRSYVPPEPLAEPRRPEAKTPARSRLLRKVLRRERSLPPTDVDASPAPTEDHIPRKLHAERRRAGETAESLIREPPERRRLETSESPIREPPERRRLESPESPIRESPEWRRLQTSESPAPKPADRRGPVDETEPTPTRRSVRGTEPAEQSSQQSEVIEFEAPVQRQTAQVEPAERLVRLIRADAARPSAASARQAEIAVDEIGPHRPWKTAEPAPAPRRESNIERLHEPTFLPASQQEPEPAAEPGPPPRRRAEPLAAIEKHPWPELPQPLDEPDGEVEAALRAWEHQQRIDNEQTRL